MTNYDAAEGKVVGCDGDSIGFYLILNTDLCQGILLSKCSRSKTEGLPCIKAVVVCNEQPGDGSIFVY